MLTQAIGDLLPAAVGVALSPIPIVAVILMLGTPKARSNGPAFALGWVVGLVVVSVVVLVVAGGADNPDSTSSDTVNVIKLALGVAFLFMALKQWQGRPKAGQPRRSRSGWRRSTGSRPVARSCSARCSPA